MSRPHEPEKHPIQRVSSAEFVRKFSAYCDEALAGPIVLTRNGRDRLMVISVDRYKQLLSFAIMHGRDPDEVAETLSEMDHLLRPSDAGEG